MDTLRETEEDRETRVNAQLEEHSLLTLLKLLMKVIHLDTHRKHLLCQQFHSKKKETEIKPLKCGWQVSAFSHTYDKYLSHFQVSSIQTLANVSPEVFHGCKCNYCF